MIKEVEFQRMVLDAFEYDPDIWLWRSNVGAVKIDDKRFVRFGEKGAADIIGLATFRCPKCNVLQAGVFIAIELKVGKNKVSNAQLEWLNRIGKYNGIAMVLYPEDNDPIGLHDRITKIIRSQLCPRCLEQTRLPT